MAVVALLLVSLVVTNFIKSPFESVSKVGLVFIFISPYLFYYILFFARNVNYVKIDITPEGVFVKYSSLFPGSVRRAIEIKGGSFYKAEFTTSLLGLRRNMVLYQKTKSGVAKYPPINITGLNEKDFDKLVSLFKAQ